MKSMKDLLGDDPPAFGYPSQPGFKAAGTSQDAAKAMLPTAADLRARALAHIIRCPSTADEAAAAIQSTVLAVRPRISELRADGMVRIRHEAGKPLRRRNASGQTANVWEATDKAIGQS